GSSAAYFVVPLLAALVVWTTYVLARRVAGDARTAMAASILLAFSPIFIFQSLQPMSDVPVTACWMAAWTLAMSPRRWAPLGAGLVVSLAVLTRPNLVVLAIVLAFVVASRSTGRSAVARFAWFAS